jgi:hypothetical protein
MPLTETCAVPDKVVALLTSLRRTWLGFLAIALTWCAVEVARVPEIRRRPDPREAGPAT